MTELSRTLEVTDLGNEIARTNHKLKRFKTLFPVAVSPIVCWWLVHAFAIHWDATHCHLWIIWALVFTRWVVVGRIQHVKQRKINRLCELSDTKSAGLLLPELTTCSRNQILPLLKTFCRVTEQSPIPYQARIDGSLRRMLLGILRDSELPVFFRHPDTETVVLVLRILVLCDDIGSIPDVKRLETLTKSPEVREIAKDTLSILEASALALTLSSTLLRPSSGSLIGNERWLLLPAQPGKQNEAIDTLLRPSEE